MYVWAMLHPLNVSSERISICNTVVLKILRHGPVLHCAIMMAQGEYCVLLKVLKDQNNK